MKSVEKEKILEELKKIYPNHDHIIGGSPMSLDDWKNKNNPYHWIKEAHDNNVELYNDVGYGHLMLVIDGVINAHGIDCVVSSTNEYIGCSGAYTGIDGIILYKRCHVKKEIK